jgi:hypothetical protein
MVGNMEMEHFPYSPPLPPENFRKKNTYFTYKLSDVSATCVIGATTIWGYLSEKFSEKWNPIKA